MYGCPIRRTAKEIQKKVVKQGARSAASRFLYASDDREAVASWRNDLMRVLHIFNVCSVCSG